MLKTERSREQDESMQASMKAVLADLYQSVEDCREILPLVPLLEVLANGRSGWGPVQGALIICSRSSSGGICLNCHTGKFVYESGKKVDDRQLLSLVAEEFDLKARLGELLERCLNGYYKGYNPAENRRTKSEDVLKELKRSSEALSMLFKQSSAG